MSASVTSSQRQRITLRDIGGATSGLRLRGRRGGLRARLRLRLALALGGRGVGGPRGVGGARWLEHLVRQGLVELHVAEARRERDGPGLRVDGEGHLDAAHLAPVLERGRKRRVTLRSRARSLL